MTRGNRMKIISWTRKKAMWVFPSHGRRQWRHVLKTRIVSWTSSTCEDWERDGGVTLPGGLLPSLDTGPLELNSVFWEARWQGALPLPFIFTPPNYFPGHPSEGSIHYSYKIINLMEMFYVLVVVVGHRSHVSNSSSYMFKIEEFYFM